MSGTAPERVDLLIEGPTVVTVDPARSVIPDGAVAVRAGRIVAVGAARELVGRFEPDRRIDARGKVAFPGLVNTHTHLFQTLLKGLGDDRVLVDWFRCMTGPSAAALDDEDCYWAALAGSMEALRSGTTCIKDFMYVHPVPGLSDAVVSALDRSGIRAVFARGFCDTGAEEGVPPPLVEDLDSALADCERVAAAYGGAAGGRITIRFAPCMIWTVSEAALREVRALASRLGVGLTMHVSETPFELENSRRRFGLTDVQFLGEIGFMGPDVLAVHCVHVGPDGLRVLREHGVSVSHNPASNMYLASGVAPVPEMIEAGITVGLASDGPASSSNHNMIEIQKIAALLHKVHRLDAEVITAERVLEMATIDGARALGLDSEIGSLEPGKRADLIVADLESSPFAGPVHHPVSSLVYSAIGSEVETVIVDGRVVVDGGHMVGLDERAVLAAAADRARKLVDRAGTGWLRDRPWRSLPRPRPDV